MSVMVGFEGVVAAAAAAAAVAVTVTVAVAATTTAAAAAPLCDGYIGGGGGGREDMGHVHSHPAEPQTADDNDANKRIESGRQLRLQAGAQARVRDAMWNLMTDRDVALEEDDVKEWRRRRYYYRQVGCNSD